MLTVSTQMCFMLTLRASQDFLGAYPAQAWLTPLGHFLTLPAVPSASALAWPAPEAHRRPLQLPPLLPDSLSPGRSGWGPSTCLDIPAWRSSGDRTSVPYGGRL